MKRNNQFSISGFVGSFAAMTFVAGLLTPAFGAVSVVREDHKVIGASTHVRTEVDVSTAAALDVLMVVDDSGSMTQHQANLLANIDGLVAMARDSGLNMHVGVVTTSADQDTWSGANGQGQLVGNFKKFAATSDSNFETVLKDNLKAAMTVSGSGFEKPFAAVQLALSEPLRSGVNAGFFRENAGLAVFILTDAEDQSPGTATDFVSFIQGLKKNAPATVHAAYVPSANVTGTCQRDDTILPLRIEEVLNAFGTLQSSVGLCDADYSLKLKSLLGSYAGTFAGLDVVTLQLVPIVKTIKVTYGSQALRAGDLYGGWVYDSRKNQIRLGSQINWASEPSGTKVVIEYDAQ